MPRGWGIHQKMRMDVLKNVLGGFSGKKLVAKTLPFLVKGCGKMTFFGVTVGQLVGDRGEKR